MENITINMRHEIKYVVSERQLQIIQYRLSGLLGEDSHQGEDGYRVKSLYFDTDSDRFLYEGINGIDKRTKYRIRIYNNNPNVIHFEKKYTIDNLKNKLISSISKETTEKIISKNDWYNKKDVVLDEVYALEKAEKLQPKVIVEYDRYSYVSDIGNIRITFDRNIRACGQIDEFFNDPIMIPILPQDKHILEVKYDGILPGYISRAIDIKELNRVSFSKYVLSRNVIHNNGRLEETYEY